MSPTESDLISALKDATLDYTDAKRNLARLKKEYDQAETIAINRKIKMEQLREQLRVYYATTPNNEPTHRDEEIERFRQANPEVCQQALERDQSRGK